MPDLGPCAVDWCWRPAVVAVFGPTLGPSPRLIVVGGERALQMVDSELGALSPRCLDCAWNTVEDIAKRSSQLPANQTGGSDVH
jgi:hypothetical protein